MQSQQTYTECHRFQVFLPENQEKPSTTHGLRRAPSPPLHALLALRIPPPTTESAPMCGRTETRPLPHGGLAASHELRAHRRERLDLLFGRANRRLRRRGARARLRPTSRVGSRYRASLGQNPALGSAQNPALGHASLALRPGTGSTFGSPRFSSLPPWWAGSVPGRPRARSLLPRLL